MSRSSTTTADDDAGERLAPVHPGAILREDFLAPMAMEPGDLAAACGLPTATVQGLLAERASVTGEIALRLGRYLGTSAELWMNVQARFDLETAQDQLMAEISKITPLASRAA